MLSKFAISELQLQIQDKDIPHYLDTLIEHNLLKNIALGEKAYIKYSSQKDERFTPENIEKTKNCNYTFSPYEQAVYSLCNSFNIKYTITENKSSCPTNIFYSITSKELSCESVASISIVTKVQNICKSNGYTIKVNTNQCKADYDYLISTYNSCGLSYQDYYNLISLGWTKFTIDTLYSDSFKVINGGESISNNINTFSLKEDLCFTDLTLLGVGDEFTFLNSAIQDLPEDLKNKILNNL